VLTVPMQLLSRSPGTLRLPQVGSCLPPHCGDCARRNTKREPPSLSGMEALGKRECV
jgi:hypothetical protein